MQGKIMGALALAMLAGGVGPFREGEPGTDGSVETAKAVKAKTEYTAVTMTDGRVVQFPGNRQADKTVTIEDGVVSVRIDFRNGKTVSLSSNEVSDETKQMSMGHGMSQKIGDEYSGEKDPEDMFLAAEDMVKRLKAGEWTVPRQTGDSFQGAGIVIKAIMEASGKDAEYVKNFLNGKLEKAKAAGEKLSRKDLYDGFKNPNSRTGAIIERLEREARAKSSKVNADELLTEVGGN